MSEDDTPNEGGVLTGVGGVGAVGTVKEGWVVVVDTSVPFFVVATLGAQLLLNI